MSKQKLRIARTLIEQKRYPAARKLLRTVDHPIATKWLKQLDRIDPPGEQQPEQPASQAQAATQPVAQPQKKRRSEPVKTKTRSAQPSSSNRRLVLVAFLTGVVGFAIGLILGMALSSNDEPGILPLDLTRQAIMDANSTTDAQIAEATAKAAAGPSDLELTATAIINLNATTVANIDATATAASNPATETEFVSTPTEIEGFPTTDLSNDFPFDSSDNTDNQSPFDLGSAEATEEVGGASFDSTLDDGPPFGADSSPEATAEATGELSFDDNEFGGNGAPFSMDATPTREGG